MKKMNMTMEPMRKMKMKVKSDHFFNHPKHMEEMSHWADVCLVDIHGGFVPTSKDESNLKKTEQCIRDRFSLNTHDMEEY